ncbi:MAG: 4-hydroxy-tetrahydrodipicolinate synthase [Phycisphaerales bacterium]|nr:MAG: 4-hydroxy-tetrahydrodipicolinate synthase [Phycisphaerales bacterium]
MTVFRGAFTALVTPFTADGSAVDFDRLTCNIDYQAEGGVTGVVPCGTTGESPTLSDDEHRAVVERTIQAAKSHSLLVIAGAGSNSTAHAVALHRLAHQAGADASLQVNPYYNRPSQEGLYRHFSTIADSCDLPVVLYNIPGRTGVALTPETLQRLAEHPNIQAVKDATGGLATAGNTILHTNLAVLSGDDPLTLPLMSIGALGVISVLSNIVPRPVAALCDTCLAGDWDLARDLHYQLYPLATNLLKLDTNPVPIKTAMKLLGRDTGALRPPLCPPTEQIVDRLNNLLTSHDLSPDPSAAHQRSEV